MKSSANNNFIARVVKTTREDPKKFGILGILLLVLGFMLLRQFSSGPQTAAASNVSSQNAANLSGSDTASSDNQSIEAADASPVAIWIAQPAEPLTRNLFNVNLDLFPTDQPQQRVFEAEGPRIWDEIAKSLLDHADQQERKQEMLSALQAQARALDVTSVMMGSRPQAIIHGELVGEGDVVEQFRVLKIEPRRIVVERDGIRLEINIK